MSVTDMAIKTVCVWSTRFYWVGQKLDVFYQSINQSITSFCSGPSDKIGSGSTKGREII